MRYLRCFFVILSVLLLSFSGTEAVYAFDVTIGDFGGAGNSTNGSWVSGVWTPNAISNLDYADLNAQLSGANARVTTNGAGNILIDNPGYAYNIASNRQLTLTATGNVTIYGIFNGGGTGSLATLVNATGAVSITSVGGVITNGGSFTSYGTTFDVGVTGLHTDGGNVQLHHTGGVNITNGGVTTGGGDFTSYGTTFLINGTGLHTDGGNVQLHHTGGVDITNGGVTTGGGDFTSYGTTLNIIDTGLHTDGGNVQLHHTGGVDITNGGVTTGGGDFTSYGTTLNIIDIGLHTDGGNIQLNHSGAVNLSGTGITSGGGRIEILSNQNIILNPGVLVLSGNPANGGDIFMQSKTGITVNATATVSSLSGSGGILTVEGPVALNATPVLGAGNISFIIRRLIIPTLNEWGMMIFLLLAGLGAVYYLRRQKTAKS